jgi:ketosteroid isomerase-like protein
MEPISADQVRQRVQRFWNVLSSKAKAEFEAMYLPSATVFAVDGRRAEPARLMVVRRARELMSASSSVAAKTGLIEVQLLGPGVAVSSYPLHFSTTRNMPNGRRYHAEIPYLRATQLFVRDADGQLRIIHEHLSSADPVAVQEVG